GWRLLGGDHAVSGRMVAAVPERRAVELSRRRAVLDVVPRQVVSLSVFLHLYPGDAAALPLRPVDAVGVEGADPAGDCQPGRHRHREGVVSLMGEAIAFYFISTCILGF